MFNKYVYVSIW